MKPIGMKWVWGASLAVVIAGSPGRASAAPPLVGQPGTTLTLTVEDQLDNTVELELPGLAGQKVVLYLPEETVEERRKDACTLDVPANGKVVIDKSSPRSAGTSCSPPTR